MNQALYILLGLVAGIFGGMFGIGGGDNTYSCLGIPIWTNSTSGAGHNLSHYDTAYRAFSSTALLL